MKFKKVLLTVSILSIVASCNPFYTIPSKEDIVNLCRNELNYDSLYFVSKNDGVNDSLLKGTSYENNPYLTTFVSYGLANNKEMMLVHGYDEYSRYFEPFEIEYMFQNPYEKVVEFINSNVNNAKLTMDFSNDIELFTNRYLINEYFKGSDVPDYEVVFRYNTIHYIYEVNGNLQYKVINVEE